MFFNLAWRNSKRSRNENLIYFLTMVTAVAAFYIVLSLGAQDVIRFLSSLESDAVERLLTNLLPTVYVCALLLVDYIWNISFYPCILRPLWASSEYCPFGLLPCDIAISFGGSIFTEIPQANRKVIKDKENFLKLT